MYVHPPEFLGTCRVYVCGTERCTSQEQQLPLARSQTLYLDCNISAENTQKGAGLLIMNKLLIESHRTVSYYSHSQHRSADVFYGLKVYFSQTATYTV